jgi:hypothetical protein
VRCDLSDKHRKQLCQHSHFLLQQEDVFERAVPPLEVVVGVDVHGGDFFAPKESPVACAVGPVVRVVSDDSAVVCVPDARSIKMTESISATTK